MVSDINDKGPNSGIMTPPVADMPTVGKEQRLGQAGDPPTIDPPYGDGLDGNQKKGTDQQLESPGSQIDLAGASDVLGDFFNMATLFFEAMQEMKKTQRSERQMEMDKAYQKELESIEQKKSAASQQMLGATMSFGANIVGNALTIAFDGISIFCAINKAVSPVAKELEDVPKEAENVIKQVTEEMGTLPEDLNQVSDEMDAVKNAVEETMTQTYKEVSEKHPPDIAREAALFAGKKTADGILKAGYDADLDAIGKGIQKELTSFVSKKAFQRALVTVRNVFAEKGLDISAKVSKGVTEGLGSGVGKIEEAGAKQTDVDADKKKAEADKIHSKERMADDLAREYNDSMQTIRSKMDEMIQSQNKAKEAAARI